MKHTRPIVERNVAFVWLAAATGAVLLVPLIAMQFMSDVKWTAWDFIVIGSLLMVVGSAFILLTRHVRSHRSRLLLGLISIALVAWLWAELAVGVFTNWGS